MWAEVATVKPEECKLYVAGIRKSVGSVPMCQVFRKIGVVKEAFNTRQGFGFVTFSNRDEAQNCMKTFNGTEALGQEIYIAPAKEKWNVDKVTGDSSKRKYKNVTRQGKDLCGKTFEWIHSGSGIGRKLMEKAGWRNGESLGIKGDGLKRALDGRDFGQCSRYGLGFGNYLLVNNNLKKKKMWEKPNQSVLANKINKEYTPRNGVLKDKKDFTLKEKAKKEEYNIRKEKVKKEFKIRKENIKKEKWKIKKERVMKEAKIKTHLQAGKFNDAYQTALSARYSSLVMYTCEMLDPLFDHEKCPLTQSVLLSLIQQLGVDFQDKTELKLRYLFEAVVNLDVTNPTTKKKIVGTMAGLRTALLNYIKINPSSKMTANMRMLQMAIQFKTDVVRVVKIDF